MLVTSPSVEAAQPYGSWTEMLVGTHAHVFDVPAKLASGGLVEIVRHTEPLLDIRIGKFPAAMSLGTRRLQAVNETF